jgi:hypothetical protein
MQFNKDIFISYAHIDDESLVASQKGWITEFHRALDIRLAQLLGRRPNIWRDLSLQGNHVFDQQIVSQFSQVAVMISILTPRYVKSDWCIREVNEFYATCEQNIGFTIQNKARIFKVVKTPVRLDLHPEKIQNVLGYEFFSTDANSGRVKEYGQVFGQQSEIAYWEKLDDLANDICSFLESLEGTTSTSGHTPNPVAASTATIAPVIPIAVAPKQKKKIYLAESSYDTLEFRDSIKRELQDLEYTLLPNKQLPLIAPVLHTEVTNFIQEADLCIHLMGSGYGVVPEGTQKSIVEIQNEIATAQSAAKGLPRLIWMPENNVATDDRQQAFLEKLQNGKEGIAGADFIISSIEDFKSIISDKLKSLEEEKKKPEPVVVANNASSTEKKSKLIYLICDMQDMDLIKPLEDVLFDNGHEVVIPIFDGDESQIREDHIENLKMCDAAIIFYGNANELWLRSKMRDFLKISGYGREQPLNIKAVYLSAPDSANKQRFRSVEAEVLNGIHEVPINQLLTLLSK